MCVCNALLQVEDLLNSNFGIYEKKGHVKINHPGAKLWCVLNICQILHLSSKLEGWRSSGSWFHPWKDPKMLKPQHNWRGIDARAVLYSILYWIKYWVSCSWYDIKDTMVVGRVGKVLRLVRVMRILRVFKVQLPFSILLTKTFSAFLSSLQWNCL